MNRGEIEQNLDYIQKCTDHYFINSNDPNYGFFVFCELPEACQRIREELTPWYTRLWWWLCYKSRLTWGIEDEIPF